MMERKRVGTVGLSAARFWVLMLVIMMCSISCQNEGNMPGAKGVMRRLDGGRVMVWSLRSSGFMAKQAEGHFGGQSERRVSLRAGQLLYLELDEGSIWSLNNDQKVPLEGSDWEWNVKRDVNGQEQEQQGEKIWGRKDETASVSDSHSSSSLRDVDSRDWPTGNVKREASNHHVHHQSAETLSSSSFKSWDEEVAWHHHELDRYSAQRQRGRGGQGDEVRLNMTQAGRYVLWVWPLISGTQPSLLASVHQYFLTVTPGATYAPHCKLCYIPPFDGLKQKEAELFDLDLRDIQLPSMDAYTVDKMMTKPCISFMLNQTAPFRTDASPPSNETVWNTSFPLCQERICVTLQVRRYDAWGNPIGADYSNSSQKSYTGHGGRPLLADSDIITTELLGIESAVKASDIFGNGTLSYTSDGTLDKYETWVHGVDYTEVGPVLCNSYFCPLIKVVGPNTFVQTWITVRINGSPVGFGNPVFTRTVPGRFANFGLDVSSINGSITPHGAAFMGPAIRIVPVDALGIKLLSTFPKPCQGPWPEDEWTSRVGANSSYCRQQAMENLLGAEADMRCMEDVGNRTKNITALSRTGFPGESVKISFLPLDNCTAAGCDAISPDEALPAACEYCEWADDDDQAFSYALATTTAALCTLHLHFTGNPTYGIKPIVVPAKVPMATPPSWTFAGDLLEQGSYNLRISAGPPSPTTSSKHENASYVEGTIRSNQTTIVVDIILKDEYGNPSTDWTTSFRSVLKQQGRADQTLEPPFFNQTSAVWSIYANVTVSGVYQVQVLLAPFFDSMWGSPFLVLVHPDLPIASNTQLLSSTSLVVIGFPAAFFLQCRDKYLNLVSSSQSEYFSKGYFPTVPSGNRAPGFWIWAKPRATAFGAAPSDPILDQTGTNFLRCPGMCAGEDPGFGALKAAFTPQEGGVYDVKLQYCDPGINGGVVGFSCFDKVPQAYDLTLMRPPQPPNICSDIPAGSPGSARPFWACEIGRQLDFTVEATPDRIVMERSTIEVPQNMKVGITYSIDIFPKDRLLRNAALPTSRCTFVLSYFDIFSGSCIFNASHRTFHVPFTPNVSGIYNISIELDDSPLSVWDLSVTVTSSILNYDQDQTTAIGLGLSLAAAGINNTFVISLRDTWGGIVRVGQSTPLVGEPFFEDCGYSWSDLPSGEPTSGYGLIGDDKFGIEALPWGCRYSFHTYLVDRQGQIIRPAQGFRVNKIDSTVDGTVEVRYEIDEPGEFLMYARYLPTSDAGNTFFSSLGSLSLERKGTGREGQIHGSPFRIKVLPSSSESAKSYVTGPGIDFGVVGQADWARFDVVSRDSFGNLSPCNRNELDVVVLDPAGARVGDVMIQDGTEHRTECHVSYLSTITGVHTVEVNLRDLPLPGSPFKPSFYLSAGMPSDSRSYGRLITPMSTWPCFEAFPRVCNAYSPTGSNLTVVVSARDALGALPDDTLSTFTVKVFGPEQALLQLTTVREVRGEHSTSFSPTRSGLYMVSVLLGLSRLSMDPQGGLESSVFVIAGPIHPIACLLIGSGLTAASAGAESVFIIVARDQYGNGIVPSPSVSQTEALPGRGRIQVVIRGQDNTTVFGGVLDRGNGTFYVSYTLTAAARYTMDVSLLDKPPGPIPTRTALLLKGVFQQQFSQSVPPPRGGIPISRRAQPWNVEVSASPACAMPDGRSTGLSCWGVGSLASLIQAFAEEGVVAGQTFGVSVLFRDACNNPSAPAPGTMVGFSLYGPVPLIPTMKGALMRGAVYPDGIDLDSVLVSPSAFENSSVSLMLFNIGISEMVGASMLEWQGTTSLSRSGAYAVRVIFEGKDVHGGLFRLNVSAREEALDASQFVVSGLEDIGGADGRVIKRYSDGFSFSVEARDIYGNSATRGGANIVAFASTMNQAADGTFAGNIVDSGDGVYYVMIPRFGVAGMHTLSLLVGGIHAGGSPWQVDVVGGMMVPSLTDVLLSPFPGYALPEQREGGRVASTYATSRFAVKVLGRDAIGLKTRLGVDELRMSLYHVGLGKDITASESQLVKTRTARLCIHANITYLGNRSEHVLCEEDYSGNESDPLFSYQVQRDATERVSFVYKTRHGVKCRSASGYDHQERLWDNLMTVAVPVVIFTTEGNITTNRTEIMFEKHPKVILNGSECAVECAKRACTCATHFWSNSSLDYRHGTCILMGKDFFLEEHDGTDRDLDYRAIFLDKEIRERWFDAHPREPILAWAFARLAGNTLLSITIGGQHTRGSPFPLNVMAGPHISAARSSLSLVPLSSSITTASLPEIPLPQNGKLYAVAGMNFSATLNARDDFDNELALNQAWEAMVPNATATFTATSSTLGGVMVLLNSTTFTIPFSPIESGAYSLALNVSGQLLNAKSFPIIFVLPRPSVPPGSTASASPLSCTVPCTFSVLIPPDPYGNTPVASCTFFVLDNSVKAYRRSASPAVTDSVDSRGLLNRTYLVTTSGVMQVRCDFWRASPKAQLFEISGSPFFLTVANAVAVPSKTQVFGGGIMGGAAGMRAEIIIMPKDAFDNIVSCTAGDVAFSFMPSGGPVITVADGVNACLAHYTPSSSGSYPQQYVLNIAYQGLTVIASQNVTLSASPLQPWSADVSCSLVGKAASSPSPQAYPCFGEASFPSTPVRLRFSVNLLAMNQAAADLSQSNVTLVMHWCRLPLSSGIGLNSCVFPLDTFSFHWISGDSVSFANSSSIEGNSWVNVAVGNLTLDLNLSGTGAYFLMLDVSSPLNRTGVNTSFFSSQAPSRAYPWLFCIAPGPSDANRTTVSGPGIERVRLAEPTKAQIVDRDSFGNLRSGEAVAFSVIARLSAGGRTLMIPVAVTPELLCAAGTGCIPSGIYTISYFLSAPETCSLVPGGCDGGGTLNAGVIAMDILCNRVGVLSAAVIVDFQFAAYTPAFATAEVALPVQIIAGNSFSFCVQPRNALGPTGPSYEKMAILVVPEQKYTVQQTADSFSVIVSITTAGKYSIRVLDGLADIRGSSFDILVVPSVLDPTSIVIVGSGAVTAFLSEIATFSILFRDQFGNIMTAKRTRTSGNAFLSHELGLQDMQAFSAPAEGGGELITYTARYAGIYRLVLTINGSPAEGALVQDIGKRLQGGLSQVKVIAAGVDALKSFFTGVTDFTSATAGIPMTFTITARDRYGVGRTVWGDAFFATITSVDNGDAVFCKVIDNVYERIQVKREEVIKGKELSFRSDCMIGCSLPFPTYAVSCLATRSGGYHLSITTGGLELTGSPLMMSIHPAVLNHNTTRLLQVRPKRSYLTVNLILASATANLVDGSFLRIVGKNTFRILALDKFGNRVPAKGPKDGVSIQHILRARVVKQVVKVADSASYSMYDVDADLNVLANLTAKRVAVANVTNGTQLAYVEGRNDLQMDKSLLGSYVPCVFTPVAGVEGGDYEVSFTITEAGKYRLHVYIDSLQIARHIPIEEVRTTANAETMSMHDCCVPIDITGYCPSSAVPGEVCGDLITLLPGHVDHQTTVLAGNQSKEFRWSWNGDGSGREGLGRDFPVYEMTGRDRYGNVLTYASDEFLVNIWHMNNTLVEQQRAMSLQPINPDMVCRASPPAENCGLHTYHWSGIAASISGRYRIDVTYNGIRVGPAPVYQMIRSRITSSRDAFIFGPGLEVNIAGELTYFYFRPHDVFMNRWEPDGTKPDEEVQVDFSLPEVYGLPEASRLKLTDNSDITRTRLYYYGLGLFKVEYEALPQFINTFGHFSFFYGGRTLAQERPGVSFDPITMAVSYEYNTIDPLYPVAAKSFATGSALYDHYAGDQVEVTAHGVSGFSRFGSYTWPGVGQEVGKYFKVSVRGPAGVRSLNFRLAKSERFRWDWKVSFSLTVGGNYMISVTYNGEHLQGDGSSSFLELQKSPYSLRVFGAPADPLATTLHGDGLCHARVGEVATFELATKDVYGNLIESHTIDSFKGDVLANATLVGVHGPIVPVTILSLGNGCSQGSYLVTQSGTYSLIIMVNGITVTVPPLTVFVIHGLASPANSRWKALHGGALAALCEVDPTPPTYIEGVDTESKPSVVCPDSLTAGLSLVVRVDARDSVNNTLALAADAHIFMLLEGVGRVEGKVMRSVVFSRFEASLPLTVAGTYSLSVSLSGVHLAGSPIIIGVSPASVFAAKCSLSGTGMHDTFVAALVSVLVRARDRYSNPTTLESVPFKASVTGVDASLPAVAVSVTSGYVIQFDFALPVPGTYSVSVEAMSEGIMTLVPGSGKLVSSTWRPAPRVSSAVLNDALDGMTINFEEPTDMACSTGRTHIHCNDFVSSLPTLDACCDYFDGTSCASLGAGSTEFPAKCIWESSSLIVITFGTGATVSPMDELLPLPIIRSADGSSNPITLPIILEVPRNQIPPSAFLLADAQVSTCDDIFLDASGSSGGGGRPMAYAWGVDSGLIQDQTLKSALEAASLESPLLTLAAGLVPVGSYTFFVSVENFIGQRGLANSTVMVFDGPVIGLQAAQSVVITDKDKETTLFATVSTSACHTFTNLMFQWSVTSGPALELDAKAAISTTLIISAGKLMPGGVYDFMFKAEGWSGRELRSSIISYRVIVKRGNLVVVIAGGNSIIEEGNLVQLDATASEDPDDEDSSFHYFWSCKPVLRFVGDVMAGTGITSDSACFFDTRGELLKDSAILLLRNGELSATKTGQACDDCLSGIFNFTLNVTKDGLNGSPGRWSSASVVIRIVPRRTGATVAPVAALVSRIGERVSPSELIKLEGGQVSLLDPSELQYSWSVVNVDGHCCLGPLNMTDGDAFPTGLSQTTLIIKPGELAPGIRYVFRFQAIHLPSGSQSTADMFVTVNSPPKAGTFSVSPPTGFGGDTRFVFLSQRWTDDPEDMPIHYIFVATGLFESGYYNLSASLATSTTGKSDRVLPFVPTTRIVTITAVVSDSLGAGVQVKALVTLSPPRGEAPTAESAAASALSLGTGPLAMAVALNRVNTAYETSDVASSLLNFVYRRSLARRIASKIAADTQQYGIDRRDHDGMILRKALSSVEVQSMARIREGILSDLLGLSRIMAYTQHDIQAMATSVRLLTAVPGQITGQAISSTLELVRMLAEQALRFPFSKDFYTSACNILSSVLDASRLLAYAMPSPTSHKISVVWVYEVLSLLQSVSRSSVARRNPGDESLVTLTNNFHINTRRTNLRLILDKNFGVTSLLPSQQKLPFLENTASYQLQNGFFSFQKDGNIMYSVEDGKFSYGSHTFPDTVYNKGGYPESVMPEATMPIRPMVFGPAPVSLREMLLVPYLDIQVVEWLYVPYEVAERGRADTNVASIPLERASAVTCSSVLEDCTYSDGLCTPAPVEGSQGPSYLDSACERAFDDNSTTSWAVNPSQVDAGGAGSWVLIHMAATTTVSAMNYVQRTGPKFCQGSGGYTCSTSNATCDCVVGGDKELLLFFSDGSEQRVTLAPKYDLQYFELVPVTTNSIKITVLSVYSDSSTCPSRFHCEWWNPMCANWCPNGAETIELIAVQSWEEVYDFGDGYMHNYSMRAALVSRVSSLSLWQAERQVSVFSSNKPMLFNLTVQRHSLTTNNQILAVCQSWNSTRARWTPRGVLVSGRMKMVDSGFLHEGATHECASFETGSYALVLREFPIMYRLENVAGISISHLDMNMLYNFVVFVFFCVTCCAWILSSIWTFLSWLESWRVAMIATLSRRCEVLKAAELELQSGVRIVKQVSPRPPPQDCYSIVSLVHSNVIASKVVDIDELWKYHKYHCLSRFSYLYAVISGGDDLPLFARFSCILCLIISSFATNALLLGTGDTSTDEWYWVPWRCCCFTLCMAQLLPSLYRCVSPAHAGWGRSEVSDVYQTAGAKNRPIFGEGGTERRTRIKALRKKIGEAAISDMILGKKPEYLVESAVDADGGEKDAGGGWVDEYHCSPLYTTQRSPTMPKRVLFPSNPAFAAVSGKGRISEFDSNPMSRFLVEGNDRVGVSGAGFGSSLKHRSNLAWSRVKNVEGLKGSSEERGSPEKDSLYDCDKGKSQDRLIEIQNSRMGGRITPHASPDTLTACTSSDRASLSPRGNVITLMGGSSFGTGVVAIPSSSPEGEYSQMAEVSTCKGYAGMPHIPVDNIVQITRLLPPLEKSTEAKGSNKASLIPHVPKETVLHYDSRAGIEVFTSSTSLKMSPDKRAPVHHSVQVMGLQGMQPDGTMFGARPTSIKAFVRSHTAEDKLILGAARIKDRAREARRQHERAWGKPEREQASAKADLDRTRQFGIRARAALLESVSKTARSSSCPASGEGLQEASNYEDEAHHLSRPGSSHPRPGSSHPIGTPPTPSSCPFSGTPSEAATTSLTPLATSRPISPPLIATFARSQAPSQLDIAWVTLLEAERKRVQEVQNQIKALKRSLPDGGYGEGADSMHVMSPGPPPPPQKGDELPPSPPSGKPPRQLSYYQERRILRLVRQERDSSEVTYFNGWVRKKLYFFLFCTATSLWPVESRPMTEVFFPSWFFTFCYSCQAAVLLLAFAILFMYSKEFDDAISNAWIYSGLALDILVWVVFCSH